MYLIKAEALGKTNGAATLVEFMKKRYTTVPTEMIIQSLSDKDYQTLILDERRREFFAKECDGKTSNAPTASNCSKLSTDALT